VEVAHIAYPEIQELLEIVIVDIGGGGCGGADIRCAWQAAWPRRGRRHDLFRLAISEVSCAGRALAQ
jgi:hypothetical protein